MSEQNHYTISCDYKDRRGVWIGWIDYGGGTGDTWQDAIHNSALGVALRPYKVLSETPSKDMRSGVIEMSETPLPKPQVLRRVKATIIDDD